MRKHFGTLERNEVDLIDCSGGWGKCGLGMRLKANILSLMACNSGLGLSTIIHNKTSDVVHF